MLNTKQIGLIGGSLILVGAGVYFGLSFMSASIDSKEALLGDYQKMSQETGDLIADSGSEDLCDNKEKLSAQIQEWQDELAELKDRKKDLLEQEADDTSSDKTESESLDLSDGDYTDVPAESALGDDSEPLELEDLSDLPPEQAIAESPEPELLPGGDHTDVPAESTIGDGNESAELPGGDYTDVPASDVIGDGSGSLELGDYTDVPAESALGDGSESLGLEDLSDLPPEQAIAESPEPELLPGGDHTDVPAESVLGNGEDEFTKMANLEQSIEQNLNTLISMLSLCKNDIQNKEIVSASCDLACQKYSDCASYADDDTPEDLIEAYESCMEECVDWSDETIICTNKKPIKSAADCANLSQCALKEYSHLLQ